MDKQNKLCATFAKKYSENTIALSVSIILALIFGINSPLHPWLGTEAGTDSSVFKTVVMMMERGYQPYRDSFDHKGPFLYILNWLGNRISPYNGIWWIEVTAIAITLFMLYKTARLVCGKLSSILTALTAFSLAFPYFEGGNFSEEYAMPCIAVALFFFLDYLLNGRISRLRLIISGCCFGMVLMLRPNMISVWIVFCILITILLLKEKKIKEWFGFVLWFSIGTAIVLLPIFIWLASKHIVMECFESYIIFNMKYSSNETVRTTFGTKWYSFFHFYNSVVFIFAFFGLISHMRRLEKKISISYMVYLVGTILLLTMSGMHYDHYGLILIPAVVYPIGLIFSDIENLQESGTSKTAITLVALYLLSSLILPNWNNSISSIPLKYEQKDEVAYMEVTTDVLKLIDEYTDEDDPISVYGNWDIIYVLSNRRHATRYSYQFPIGVVDPTIMDEYIASLQRELPKVIVVAYSRYDETIGEFLKKNNYSVKFCTNRNAPEKSTMLFVKE